MPCAAINDSAITIGDGNGDGVSSIAVQGGQSSSNHITLGNGAGRYSDY